MFFSIPPLSLDEAEGDLITIKCNGVEYSVHSDYFARISPLFSQILETKKFSLYLKCSNKAFKEFINACQKLPFTVNEENVDELIYLAEIFQIEKLKSVLEDSKRSITNQKTFFDEINSKLKSLAKICEIQQKEIDELKRNQHSKMPVKRSFSATVPKISPVSQVKTEEKVINFIGKPMHGIFFWLRQQTDKSLTESSFVKVSVSSMNKLSSSPDDLVENMRMCKWMSLAKKKSWVKIDFMSRILTVTAYTIRLPTPDSMLWFPKSWILEGSTDDITWAVIDEHRGNKVFEKNVAKCTWTVTPAGPFRYIRLTQTESSNTSDSYFVLCALEFFGSVYKRPDIFG